MASPASSDVSDASDTAASDASETAASNVGNEKANADSVSYQRIDIPSFRTLQESSKAEGTTFGAGCFKKDAAEGFWMPKAFNSKASEFAFLGPVSDEWTIADGFRHSNGALPVSFQQFHKLGSPTGFLLPNCVYVGNQVAWDQQWITGSCGVNWSLIEVPIADPHVGALLPARPRNQTGGASRISVREIWEQSVPRPGAGPPVPDAARKVWVLILLEMQCELKLDCAPREHYACGWYKGKVSSFLQGSMLIGDLAAPDSLTKSGLPFPATLAEKIVVSRQNEHAVLPRSLMSGDPNNPEDIRPSRVAPAESTAPRFMCVKRGDILNGKDGFCAKVPPFLSLLNAALRNSSSGGSSPGSVTRENSSASPSRLDSESVSSSPSGKLDISKVSSMLEGALSDVVGENGKRSIREVIELLGAASPGNDSTRESTPAKKRRTSGSVRHRNAKAFQFACSTGGGTQTEAECHLAFAQKLRVLQVTHGRVLNDAGKHLLFKHGLPGTSEAKGITSTIGVGSFRALYLRTNGTDPNTADADVMKVDPEDLAILGHKSCVMARQLLYQMRGCTRAYLGQLLVGSKLIEDKDVRDLLAFGVSGSMLSLTSLEDRVDVHTDEGRALLREDANALYVAEHGGWRTKVLEDCLRESNLVQPGDVKSYDHVFTLAPEQQYSKIWRWVVWSVLVNPPGARSFVGMSATGEPAPFDVLEGQVLTQHDHFVSPKILGVLDLVMASSLSKHLKFGSEAVGEAFVKAAERHHAKPECRAVWEPMLEDMIKTKVSPDSD